MVEYNCHTMVWTFGQYPNKYIRKIWTKSFQNYLMNSEIAGVAELFVNSFTTTGSDMSPVFF
jgi:hypothetical protein